MNNWFQAFAFKFDLHRYIVATAMTMIAAGEAAAAELDDSHEDALHREPASISAVELDQIVQDVLGDDDAPESGAQ